MPDGAAAAGVSGSAPAPAQNAAAAAFQAALARDAGEFPPEMPAPPRIAASTDPDAPHGRDEISGEPLVPYGRTREGRIRLKPAGPGRGHTKDDKAQVTSAAPSSPPSSGTVARTGASYREDLAGFGMNIWIAGSMLPPTRPYAQLFKEALPGMVDGWAEGAQSNATVRGYVEKLAGEGSWAWVLKVSASTFPFLMGCWELARPMKATTPAEIEAKQQRDAYKAKLAGAAQGELLQYISAQIAEAKGDELPAAA